MRITHRLHFIKLVTLTGLLLSALVSMNLWAGQRWFPKAPLFDAYMGLQAPYDYINLAVLLLLIILPFFTRSKVPVILLIIFSIYLCIDDQNRLQPWFYNYMLILLILLFFRNRVDEPNNYITVFISLQILVALIYIYSGIQKINSFFVEDTFKWMVEPMDDVFNQKQMNLIHKIGYAAPYIEIFIGFGLLIKPLRFLALPLVIIMHVFILLMLGPSGKSYNYVIWPWNMVMILLNFLLFANVKQERFFDVSILFKGLSFYIVVTLMLVFPLFSLNNKYDSYLSSSLYSANTHNCTLVLSNKAYDKLPLYVKHFTSKDDDYNILYVKHWAMNELKAPCVPEYRIFKSVQDYIIRITATGIQDVQMEFTEREKVLDF